MNLVGLISDKIIRLSLSTDRYGEPGGPINGHDLVEHANGHGDDLHLTNWVYILYKLLDKAGYENIAEWLHTFENFMFIMVVVSVISIWAIRTHRKTMKDKDPDEMINIPQGFSQNFWEIIVQGLSDFTEQGIGLGKKGRTYIPLIGSLFLFIFLNNILGIIPFMHSATSSLNTTLGLGIVVFITVQIHGMRALGLKGWFMHLAGIEPGVVATYFLWPLFLPLHVIGEIVKPVSLALRLFGNVFGEDTLIAVFVILGALSFIPFQTPFYFLALLTSFIQAMVFTLLACAYIASMSHVYKSHSG